jgi:hypothetical protein
LIGCTREEGTCLIQAGWYLLPVRAIYIMWLAVPVCTVLKQSGQDRFPLAGRTGDPLLVQKRDVVARLRVGWTVPEKGFAVNHSG